VEYDSPNQPVVNISWFHAFEYCVGNGLFLPTDAQWRYAAGGPEGYRYGTRSGGLNRKEAHYRSMVSAEIGSYPPNGFGLRDMTGNVWEWMACDPSLGRPYGLRGGCFENHDARFLRSAYREDAFSPAYADVITGFRPAAGL
jgi:formylglycine-generating enzyme required for sulfatase activity